MMVRRRIGLFALSGFAMAAVSANAATMATATGNGTATVAVVGGPGVNAVVLPEFVGTTSVFNDTVFATSDNAAVPRSFGYSGSSSATGVGLSFGDSSANFALAFFNTGTAAASIDLTIDYALFAGVSVSGPVVPDDYSTEETFGGARSIVEMTVNYGTNDDFETLRVARALGLLSDPAVAPRSVIDQLAFSRTLAAGEQVGLSVNFRIGLVTLTDGVARPAVVPVPASAALLFGALGVLCVFKRRRGPKRY
jgi:hypothetical protein